LRQAQKANQPATGTGWFDRRGRLNYGWPPGIIMPKGGCGGPEGGPERLPFGTAHCIVGLTKTGANWMRWAPPGAQP
jgi:hypothetical protein